MRSKFRGVIMLYSVALLILILSRRKIAMKKLILALMLGMILSAFAVPAFAGHRGGQDDQGENDDDQGLPIVVCPPGGCIQ